MGFTYGDDSRYIRCDGVNYPIRYETSKGYVHAYVTINGKRIVAADTERYFAFLNLQNHVYQESDLDKCNVAFISENIKGD